MDISLMKIVGTICFDQMRGNIPDLYQEIPMGHRSYRVRFEQMRHEINGEYRGLIMIESDQYLALDFETALFIINQAGNLLYSNSIMSIKNIQVL